MDGNDLDFSQLDRTAQSVLGNKKRSLSQDELEDVLRQAGWDEKQIPIMSAIGMGEGAIDPDDRSRRLVSSFNPGFGKGGKPTKEKSYGNWQVNILAHPEYDPNRLASDPLYNAKAALEIYKSGHRSGDAFNHWGAYSDGGYKKFLRKGNDFGFLDRKANAVLNQKPNLDFSSLDQAAQNILSPQDAPENKPFGGTIDDLAKKQMPSVDPNSTVQGVQIVQPPTAEGLENPNFIAELDKTVNPQLATRPRIVGDDEQKYQEYLTLSGLTDSPENRSQYDQLIQSSQNIANQFNQQQTKPPIKKAAIPKPRQLGANIPPADQRQCSKLFTNSATCLK